MLSDLSEQIEDLFQRASDLSGSERARFLDEACPANDALRSAVERLLAASSQAESNPSWADPAILHEARSAASQPVAELERYKLLDSIGSGGMGMVYKAVRADDVFSKLVAVKIVHLSGADESIRRRFVQERQILSGLEHPNIARMLDGGATDDGRPFLVMEFVDGVPLSRFLADRKPALHEVLGLFRQICSAVGYAHRHLIVHRDLKPGNILVTADGEPKLLDFGIAKLLDGSAERTETGSGAMTPDYASPEQVLGAPITTASDIYSLGVLLYEMLTGRRPYRNTTSAMELAQAITERNPEPLGGRFDQDLENIVQMAMRKEPERRYASVAQLSEDIGRYQDGFPISARPDTSGYRMRKFAGRNKLAMAAAAIVLVAVGGGIFATLREARIANRRFNDVRKLANSYLFEFHDAIKDLPGATPARQLVVKRALEYLDSLSGERGSDTLLALELASAYGKVGEVQGEHYISNLGDFPGALASFKKGLAILEPLAAANPRNPDIGKELNKSYANMGAMVMSMGDLHGAVDYHRKAVALAEQLVAARPSDTDIREILARSYINLADVQGNPNYPNLGDAKGALELYRKAQSILAQLASEDPGNLYRLDLTTGTYGRLGQMLQALDDKPGAVDAYRRVVEINERILRAKPMNAPFMREAAVGNRNLSLSLVKMNQVGQAREYGDRAMHLFEQIAKDDPKNVEARVWLADSYYGQGYVLMNAKENAAALQYLDRSVAIYAAAAQERPGEAPPVGLRTAYQLIAEVTTKMGDTVRGIASAQHEIEIDDRLLKADPKNAGAERNLGLARRQIAKAHEVNGMRTTTSRQQSIAEYREARIWYQRSLDVFLGQKARGTLIPMYASELNDTPRALERCDRALTTLER